MNKRALLSVYDKRNIVKLGQGLADLGYEIISTGGTARTLKGGGVECLEIEEITGQKELFDGRVKTLHPAVHAGILARRSSMEDMQALIEADFMSIDVVVVNLYPFSNMVKQNLSLAKILDYIDIGGPTLIRASAKNFSSVLVSVDPTDYDGILDLLKAGEVSFAERSRLARKAFQHTAEYERIIAEYFQSLPSDCNEDFVNSLNDKDSEKDIDDVKISDELPSSLVLRGKKTLDLRYGENPHQRGALYKTNANEKGTITAGKSLSGKPLSYNNILDAEVALNIVMDIPEAACSVIKHNNPCGVGIGKTLKEAVERALTSDPLSAYGSIIACNRLFGEEEANIICKTQSFVEVIIAPNFTSEALNICQSRWQNLRMIETGIPAQSHGWEIKSLRGGFLLQERDSGQVDDVELTVVSTRKPLEKELEDLLFAWRVVKHVKSNAIVLCKDSIAVGIGAGQQSRIDAAEIAIKKAGERSKGSVMASDAMIPFPDTIEVCAKAGVKAVIQPGGSKRDQEAIDTANKYNMVMVFTGMRHFRH